jgi:hypothetical protein
MIPANEAIPDRCNSIDVILVKKEGSSSTEFITDIPDARFNMLIDTMRPFKYKHFNKSFKSYCVGNLTLENANHEDIKVYSKMALKSGTVKDAPDRFMVLYNRKDKKPFHAFPSTTKIHAVFYTNRLTFRVSSRLFVNFDIQYHPEDDAIIRRVFVNYNHDINVDIDSFNMSIAPILKALSI